MATTTNKAAARDFNRPDERRPFKAHGHLDLVELNDGLMVGKAVFEPGWRWSNDVKPLAETESCEAEHLGYCLSGTMVVRMNDGEEIRIQPGQAFHLRPGHDAWIEGDEPCELLDFAGYKDYAIRRSMGKAA